MAKNSDRLLAFALRYPASWHTLTSADRRDRGSMLALEAKGFLEVKRGAKGTKPQFRLKLGDGYQAVYGEVVQDNDPCEPTIADLDGTGEINEGGIDH